MTHVYENLTAKTADGAGCSGQVSPNRKSFDRKERKNSHASGNKGNGSDKQKNRTVKDGFGTSYTLCKKLGEGGQGVVCYTDHPGVLVKIYRGGGVEDARRWARHIDWLMCQPLDELRIARPLTMITHPARETGYVMELMDGLEPLEEALEHAYQTLLDNEEHPLQGYLDTGGLERRLKLLQQLADTLARLHGRGMAYGDLSPGNIFISQSVEHHQVWLIDCDNICVSERAGYGTLHTPGYAAPEVARGDSGVNTLTDCWSFAVIAFQLLTLCHPFRSGLQMEEAEEEDDGCDAVEVQADQGALCWIYDDEDDSNAWDGSGIPLEYVVDPALSQLFQDCFDTGRIDAGARPSMAQWRDALEAAAGRLYRCDHADCGSLFIAKSEPVCDFCDEEAVLDNHLRLQFYFHEDGDDAPETGRWISTPDWQRLRQGVPVELRLAPPGSAEYVHSPLLCTLTLTAEGLEIIPAPDGRVELQRQHDGKARAITRNQRLNSTSRAQDGQNGDRFALHLHYAAAKAMSYHPVWVFDW